MIIYKCTNIKNKKCYIGQTIITLNKRRQSHESKSFKKSDNTYFHKAIRKYGKEFFIWEVICKCDNKEELDEMEFHYIKQYNSFVKDGGYNLTHGGDFNPMFYKEFRDKISKKAKGRTFKHTQESKNKISKFSKGKSYEEIYGIEKAKELILIRKNMFKNNNPMINPENIIKMKKSLCKGTYITPFGSYLTFKDASKDIKESYNIVISYGAIYRYCKNSNKKINKHMIGNSNYFTNDMIGKTLKEVGFYYYDN